MQPIVAPLKPHLWQRCISVFPWDAVNMYVRRAVTATRCPSRFHGLGGGCDGRRGQCCTTCRRLCATLRERPRRRLQHIQSDKKVKALCVGYARFPRRQYVGPPSHRGGPKSAAAAERTGRRAVAGRAAGRRLTSRLLRRGRSKGRSTARP